MYLAANLNFSFYTLLSGDVIIFVISILTIVSVEILYKIIFISVYYISIQYYGCFKKIKFYYFLLF
jgi:hypothetical protein